MSRVKRLEDKLARLEGVFQSGPTPHVAPDSQDQNASASQATPFDWFSDSLDPAILSLLSSTMQTPFAANLPTGSSSSDPDGLNEGQHGATNDAYSLDGWFDPARLPPIARDHL